MLKKNIIILVSLILASCLVILVFSTPSNAEWQNHSSERCDSYPDGVYPPGCECTSDVIDRYETHIITRKKGIAVAQCIPDDLTGYYKWGYFCCFPPGAVPPTTARTIFMHQCQSSPTCLVKRDNKVTLEETPPIPTHPPYDCRVKVPVLVRRFKKFPALKCTNPEEECKKINLRINALPGQRIRIRGNICPR